jgi:RNA polymerase sigma-70 factor (ECF subfamily)
VNLLLTETGSLVADQHRAETRRLGRMGGDTTTDETVVVRFRDGDPEAVREVYARYGRSVFGVALRALGNPVLAEEVVQQTFLQAWRASSSVDAGRELGPWLFTIARRVAIDLYRRESLRTHSDVGDAGDLEAPPNRDGHVEALPMTWEVRAAVDALPEDERAIVHLQHFMGMTHVEIAEQLDVPVGTVKSRSFRAHRRLADGLRHWQERSR